MKRGGRAGQVTIKDIAQALGVSHATVSRALNDSPLINAGTKDRIRAKAKEMGYVPDPAARVMRGELSTLVGFILPDVENHFYSATAKALAESVSAAGFQLVLAVSEDDPERERRHVEEMRRARARGIVITPSAGMLRETTEALRDMPAVQLVRAHPDVCADVVTAQDERATELSTRHLLSLGHRRIAYLGGGTETLSTGTDRLGGYNRAMAATPGAEPRRALVPPHPENGYAATRRLLQDKARPTGIVIGSSQLTLGVLDAIREVGLDVPGDISIVSYDDPDWHRLWGPGISTIELPVRQMARFAARRVAAPDERAPLPEGAATTPMNGADRFAFPVRLLERGSCARLDPDAP